MNHPEKNSGPHIAPDSYILFRVDAQPSVEPNHFSLEATQLRLGLRPRRRAVGRSKGGPRNRHLWVSGGYQVRVGTEVHGREGLSAALGPRRCSRARLDVT